MAHLLVKDMSRIGRDYLQTGFYTEVMFRQHGVHFVAVANGVDSNDQNSNEFVPFLNIMNEWYRRDLSRKQRTAIRAKGESGRPTTNCVIYGFSYNKMQLSDIREFLKKNRPFLSELKEVQKTVKEKLMERKALSDEKGKCPAWEVGKQR